MKITKEELIAKADNLLLKEKDLMADEDYSTLLLKVKEILKKDKSELSLEDKEYLSSLPEFIDRGYESMLGTMKKHYAKYMNSLEQLSSHLSLEDFSLYAKNVVSFTSHYATQNEALRIAANVYSKIWEAVESNDKASMEEVRGLVAENFDKVKLSEKHKLSLFAFTYFIDRVSEYAE